LALYFFAAPFAVSSRACPLLLWLLPPISPLLLLFSYFGSFVIFIGPHRVKNVQRFGNLVEYPVICWWCRVVPGGLGWFWVGGALALGQAHKKRGEPKAKQ